MWWQQLGDKRKHNFISSRRFGIQATNRGSVQRCCSVDVRFLRTHSFLQRCVSWVDVSNPKYIIIFGAGASFGSGEVNPRVPPMGNDLFSALQHLYPPTWGQITGGLASSFRSDFEKGMQELADTNSHAMPPLQRAMAAFFFNFSIGADNLYLEIAERVLDTSWDGAFATLNYERLLEMALGQRGLVPFVGTSQGQSNSVEICMPHGCCHIFCEGVSGGASGISMGLGVTTTGTPVVISDPGQFNQRISQDAFPPTMSYFMPSKATTTCVNFIEQQRNRFAELVCPVAEM